MKLYKLKDEDKLVLIERLTNINLLKIAYCDFVRITNEKIREMIANLERTRKDLEHEINKKEEELNKLESELREVFLKIASKTIPEGEDLNKYIYDERLEAFRERKDGEDMLSSYIK